MDSLDSDSDPHSGSATVRSIRNAHRTVTAEFIREHKEAQMPPINALENIKKHAQRTFYDATLKNMQTQLLDETSAADRARLRSCAGKYAGAWLNCIPKLALFRMSPADFRACLRLRLGLEQLCIRTDVKCRCGVLKYAITIFAIIDHSTCYGYYQVIIAKDDTHA